MRRWAKAVEFVVVAVVAVVGIERVFGGVEVPYTAYVQGRSVPLYAGAGHSFYVVGELTEGTEVTVEEIIFGWHKIASVAGTHSYIDSSLVQASTDGKSGVVVGRRAAVKAGSLEGASQSYRRQLDLLKGDKVRILGKEGKYFKIVPPRGAYVFLAPNSLRVMVAGEVPKKVSGGIRGAVSGVVDTVAPASKNKPPIITQKTRKPEGLAAKRVIEADQEHQKQAEQVITLGLTGGDHHTGQKESEEISLEESIEARSSVEVQVESTGGAELKGLEISPAVQRIEHRFRGVIGMPLEEQPIQLLIDEYQELEGRKGLHTTDRQIIAMRIKQLERQVELKSALGVVAEAAEQSADVGKGAGSDDGGVTRYAVVGTLTTSSVYNGQGLQLLYRVVDPQTDRTIMYVRPSEQLNFGLSLGKHVGLVGETVFDQGLQLRVVEVNRIDALGAQKSDSTAMRNDR